MQYKNLYLYVVMLLLSVVALGACSHQKVVEDTTPKNPTAVVETRTTNFGIKGKFASEGKTVTRIRPDMQRVDTEYKFTGAVMKRITKASSQATITRLDRNLVWEMDKKGKTYTECPLKGCGPADGMMSLPQEEESGDEAGDEAEESCPLRMVKNKFNVTETGQARVVNGFDTKEYLVAWEVMTEDDKKRKSENRVTVNLWTTPESDEIREVLQVQESFARTYAEKVALEYGGLQRVLPEEAMVILGNYFFGMLNESDRKALLDAGQKLEKIKGFPVSTKVEWRVSGNACEEPEVKEEKKESKIDLSGGVGGLLSSVAGKVVEDKVKKEEEKTKDKPVFGYVEEVISLKTEMVHDSVMNVPSGYRLETRK